MNHLASRRAAEIMTEPVIHIGQEQPLTDAVDLMLAKGVKRLPVVDDQGRFKGMINRDSLLRTGYGNSP